MARIKQNPVRSTLPTSEGKKKHRFRPGTVALSEIRRYQKTTERLISRAPFVRIVRETLHQRAPDFRIGPVALTCLQEAAEAYLVLLMKSANRCAIHAQRTTLMAQDVKLAQQLNEPQV